MIQAVLLALIAGYVDTVGYLHFNAFAGLMTGNTIFMGIEAATQQYAKAVFHAVIILSFLVGVVIARVKMRAGLSPWIAMTLAGGLLIVCSYTDHNTAAILLSLAMGIQNSAANRFNGVALKRSSLPATSRSSARNWSPGYGRRRTAPFGRAPRSSRWCGSRTRWGRLWGPSRSTPSQSPSSFRRPSCPSS